MTVFKQVLIGSLIYGTLTISSLTKLGDPNIPSNLHQHSGLYKIVESNNYNAFSAQNQLFEPEF